MKYEVLSTVHYKKKISPPQPTKCFLSFSLAVVVEKYHSQSTSTLILLILTNFYLSDIISVQDLYL